MSKAADKALNAIRLAILNGRYSAGMHLREGALAEEIGVSRTPVREALRRLASDGFVEFRPNYGTFVAEWSEQSLSDLIEVRAELAAMATRRAAQNIRHDDLETLGAINREMSDVVARRPPDFLEKLSSLNLKFHDVVFSNSKSKWLPLLLQQTAHLPVVQWAHYGYGEVEWVRAFERYSDIIRALRAGDGEWAASLFKAHFYMSKHAIKALLAARDESDVTSAEA